jgi:hypothetical protein
MNEVRQNLNNCYKLKKKIKRPTNALACINVILLHMEYIKSLPNLTVRMNFAKSLKILFTILTGERKLNVFETVGVPQTSLEMTNFVYGQS